MVYEHLDTAFVNLPALLRYLQQRDFTGRVHVELDEYDGDIYLAARKPVEARERDHATGRAEEGEAALQRLLVRARAEGGLVSVYEYPAAESFDELRLRPSEASDAAAQDALDRRTVLQLSGDIIAAVERAVGVSSTESFAAHFRAAREELTDDYPFLAALAACVEYVEGEARLSRQADAGAFVEGVCAALRRVVERVAALDTEGRGVRREVARELAALAARRRRHSRVFASRHNSNASRACVGREKNLIQLQVRGQAIGWHLLVKAFDDLQFTAKLCERFLPGTTPTFNVAASRAADLERAAEDALSASAKVGRTTEMARSHCNHAYLAYDAGYFSP